MLDRKMEKEGKRMRAEKGREKRMDAVTPYLTLGDDRWTYELGLDLKLHRPLPQAKILYRSRLHYLVVSTLGAHFKLEDHSF